MDGCDGELCVHVAALNGFKCYNLSPDKTIILDEFDERKITD